MQRPTLRTSLGLVITVALCVGCGSSGPAKVSAATYVRSVCSAIAPLERDVVSRSSALNNSTAASAAEAKRTLQGFLDAVVADADRALSKLKAAGTPDISSGKTVAATIVKAFTQLRDAMRMAETQAISLPTDSPTSYKAAASALNAHVRGALGNIDVSGLSNRDLESAAAKEPACKSLNS